MESAILHDAISLAIVDARCLRLVRSTTLEGALLNECSRVWQLINTWCFLPNLRANRFHLKIATEQVATAALYVDEANLVFLPCALHPIESLT